VRQVIKIGVLLLGGVGLPVMANDYIVARSSDPAIERGSAWAAGSSLALGAGQSVTMVTTGGDVLSLEGADGGIVLPARAAGGSASAEALQSLIKRPMPRRSFGAMRGPGDCPSAEDLKTLDEILAAAAREGCDRNARVALENYLSADEAEAESTSSEAVSESNSESSESDEKDRA
jgi:hypothetical protein